jgi:hypothetical protein
MAEAVTCYNSEAPSTAAIRQGWCAHPRARQQQGRKSMGSAAGIICSCHPCTDNQTVSEGRLSNDPGLEALLEAQAKHAAVLLLQGVTALT